MILETRHSLTEILSRQPLFRGLGGLELSRLADASLEYRVNRHEVLIQKGGQAEYLYLMVSGQAKLFLPSAQGSEKIVRLVHPGEMFGEESVILGQPSVMTAQANKDSILVMVPRHALMEAFHADPMLCCEMMTCLAQQMRDLVDNMQSCTQLSSSQRVAHYLNQMAPQEGQSFEVELDANKQTIASQLNLAPETFSRVLSRFARQGVIHIQGRVIQVRDAALLRTQCAAA